MELQVGRIQRRSSPRKSHEAEQTEKQTNNILRGCLQLQLTEKLIQGGLTNEGNVLPIIRNSE